MTVKPIIAHHNFVYDGAQLNIYHANKGEGLPQHEHNFAHATLCCAGSIYVRNENKEVLLNKRSKPINLVAKKWHEIEAAEDGTVFINVFAEGKY